MWRKILEGCVGSLFQRSILSIAWNDPRKTAGTIRKDIGPEKGESHREVP
jgi:hypothetical protein